MWNTSLENFGRCEFGRLVICGTICHDLYVVVSVSLRCVSCDVDFEYLFQLSMCALVHADRLRVFQGGVVKVDAGCLHQLAQEL